jgi:pimeloyl-ACP methyl ester carboxylesterase
MRLAVLAVAVLSVTATTVASTATASAALRVHWMKGVSSPGTPARYDKVGVLKIGSAHARNVLVVEPGTSAGSAYFVPLARWIVSRLPGWQVWSVERRENLLEDQSVLDRVKKQHLRNGELFNYYLGWLTNHKIKRHFQPISDSRVGFAKRWGLSVAIGDLHRVIAAARRLHGKVVLGGHSLGGGVVTAYASWNFKGRPGADQLAGLVFIDGGSFGTESISTARTALAELNQPSASPWLTFGGIPAPYAGLFSSIGSTAALIVPDKRSLGQESGELAAFGLTPKVPLNNLAQFGYALNVGTSPLALAAAQAHLGRGIDAHGKVRGWDGKGALTPIKRFARMFSGYGVVGADGSEWYFPQRLTDDLGGIGSGLANPAGRFLGLRSTLGRRLPHRLFIYAFGAALGRQLIVNEAHQLAIQSHIPRSHLTLINRAKTYAHNDPVGAYPHNVFFAHLIPFLRKVAGRGH